jgi:hypothetical protein
LGVSALAINRTDGCAAKEARENWVLFPRRREDASIEFMSKWRGEDGGLASKVSRSRVSRVDGTDGNLT